MEAQFHEIGAVQGAEIEPSMDSVTPILTVQDTAHQTRAQAVSRHAAERRLKGALAAIMAKRGTDTPLEPATDADKTFHACPACLGTRVERTQLVDGLPLYANNACRQCQGTGRQ